ncbi:hypothetical protein SCLCIDRAFT_120554 [Scleroderma citrinum Foug A]|uniref:Mid2 domain-containing protein n=1 Tax=Scleroderma citrinum Foug A TaxID=1036808 RepID=A0A0C3AB99_9AGAM|nr:hypothetical protein SCLCIDRAFT_120554 [Scleroderma citrinum Foug A]
MLPSNLRWTSLAILATGLLSMRPLWASAQQTTAVCMSQYDWMDNSKSQNPCLVAAYAQGACSGGQFTVDPLDANTHYVGPYVSEANPCECNSITYNLIAACSICQNRTYIAWSSWSTNCTTVYPGVYPENVPSGTAIPHWAYQDVTTSDDFNATLAQLTGDTPESTATKAQATATAVTSSALPASITSSGNAGTQSPSPSSSSKSNTGAIVGGAVGGVVVLGAIAAFITWFCIRRRRRQTKAPSAMYDGSAPGGTNSMYTTSPFTPSATQPKLYDPSDPTTFPASPPSPTIHTTPSTGYQNNSIHSNLYAAQGGRPGAYSGVPEL